MSKCVNLSSKEFKDTCQRLDIHPTTLEIIVHKYQNTEGNENSFPSDSYIKGVIEGIPTYEASKAQISLWDKLYSEPKVFDSIEEANAYADEARSYYDNNSTTVVKTTDNRFKVTVSRPTSDNKTFEVSTAAKNDVIGDSRFSALNARFKSGTIIEGIDVGGRTIEDVYQSVIKKSKKGQAPSVDSKLYRPSVSNYTGNITPDASTIFVFGSNPEGRHGAGAAKIAKEQFGAIYGQGEGLQGNAYALPTKDLRVTENRGLRSISEAQIIENIKKLYDAARQNPDKQFKIAYRNTNEVSLNGYTGLEMIDMFLKAGPIPTNIVFSKEWVDTRKFNLSKEELEEISYTEGYLPLWQEWARQNPELIEELRAASKGKTLVDRYARTAVNQARALTDILNDDKFFNNTSKEQNTSDEVFEKDTIRKTFKDSSAELLRQIDNLFEDNLVSASEVRHTAEQVVYWISDAITEYLNNPEKVINNYKKSPEDIDKIKKMSRIELVKYIGVKPLLDRCKTMMFVVNSKLNDENASFDLQDKADLYNENFGALIKLAYDTFITMEDFAIVSTEESYEVTDDIDLNTEDDLNKNNDSIKDELGNQQEHWQIESRSLDVLTGMSSLVKRALAQCFLISPDGTIQQSELGIKERVQTRDAVNSILRWTQGSLTLSDMISRLKEKQADNMWISQIIQKLESTKEDANYAENVDFKSQFFSVFMKHAQAYDVINIKDGKYTTVYVNENPALNEVYNSITTQFKIGSHPLFTLEGVNKDNFKEFRRAVIKLISVKDVAFEQQDIDLLVENIGIALEALGFPLDADFINTIISSKNITNIINNLSDIVDNISAELNNPKYDPFKFQAANSIGGRLKKVLQPFTDKMEDTAVSSFFENGKMYQSYVTPSYMSKLMTKFHLEGAKFDEFIQEEFGKYDWFKDKKDNRWRISFLEKISKMPVEQRKEFFKHKVQLTFNKHGYMREMSDSEYTLAILSEYFSVAASTKEAISSTWYKVPMLSNKPSLEFLKLPRFTGPQGKIVLLKHFSDIVFQELSRIQTVNSRNKKKGDSDFIKNFDDKGNKFHFMDFLNPYIGKANETARSKNNPELKRLLTQKLEEGICDNEAELLRLIKAEIEYNLNERVKKVISNWEASGIIKAAEKIKGILSNIKEALSEFIWNDAYASMTILQLTITDPAYYKNAEDLQKRLAQIHAPGVRGNIEATDYEGNLVTDGKHRAVYLKDFDKFKSNIIENVSVVFERKLSEIKDENQRKATKAYYDSILKQFEEINVADAQAFCSPTAYRKKALIFGKWNKSYEEAYQKLKEGDASQRNLELLFNPTKPFVYSQIEKQVGVEGAPMQNIKMGVQNKNSEYLLVLADAITRNEDIGKPNLLRALFDIMEDSAKENPTKGIDAIEFESAVKVGLQGAIDINKFYNDLSGETNAKNEIRKFIYKGYDANTDSISGLEYNENSVHEVPFEDYCIQQEVPAHFKDHEQAHGSQIRAILYSDLEEVDYLGNEVKYTFKDGKETKSLSSKEFKEEYERNIAENIKESLTRLEEEFNIGSKYMSREAKNATLAEILQKEILSSPRYGIDLLQACSLDANGEFRIPLGDPIQSKRIEQLINSIVKNRVNKQTIPGGPLVQVANYGTSKELNIVFKSKDGGNLMTESEWNENKTEHSSYKEYIKDKQDGIAYFEVFAPAYSKELFDKFTDSNSNIDIEAIEATDPELLKMVGYRIPTEDKYSMAPLKIVGFLPAEAGDGIMLPADITLLSGSDFDVDKLYVMRKTLGIKTKSKEKIYKDLFKLESEKPEYDGNSKELASKIDKFLTGFEVDINMRKHPLWDSYIKVAYEVKTPTEGRDYRNNKIIDMTYSVLTHETTASKMLNPGGFPEQSKMGYAISAYKNADIRNKYSWEDLMSMSVEELKDLSYEDKNLSFIDTNIQFYKQNAAAGQILGMFAVQKSAHAILESNGYHIDVAASTDDVNGIRLGSKPLVGYVAIDPKVDFEGNLIGKTLGSLVASAADAVKDPVLNLMNINSNTANVLNTLIRLGVPFRTASLLLSQPIISETLAEYTAKSIEKDTSFKSLLKKKLSEIEATLALDENSKLHTEMLTEAELVEGLKDSFSDEAKIRHNFKVLTNYLNAQAVADDLRGLNYATRFNAISNSVGPLIVDNITMTYKMQEFSKNILKQDPESLDYYSIQIYDVFEDHPMLKEFSKGLNMANSLLSEFPTQSRTFYSVLEYLSEDIRHKILTDRKLFSKLSDFFQSYIFIIDGIDASKLPDYIQKAPKRFMESEARKRHLDNPFIKAIKLDTITTPSGETRAVLKLDTTGMDQTQKELISCGWIDFHKAEPEASEGLFYYNFFKTGLSFSPKSFISLAPTYVKERMPNYRETFKTNAKPGETLPMSKIEDVSIIVDQFIRNNWDNNKLVPKVEFKDVIMQGNIISITAPEVIEKHKDSMYIKVKQGNNTLLFKKTNGNKSSLIFTKVDPLGSNGEYLEISTKHIEKAIEVSSNPISKEDYSPIIGIDDMEQLKLTKKVSERITYLKAAINSQFTVKAQKTFKELSDSQKKEKKDRMFAYFKNFFEKNNIKYSEQDLEDIYDIMC